jgi:hypothetical protein
MIGHVPVAELFETHLTVADFDRSVTFYRDRSGSRLRCRSAVPRSSGSAGWARRCAGCGRSALSRWGPCTSRSTARSRMSWAAAAVCKRWASRRCRSLGPRPTSRASSAGCPRPPSTSETPTALARAPGDAGQGTAVRSRNRVLVAMASRVPFMTVDQPLHVTLVSGSLRSGSTNTAVRSIRRRSHPTVSRRGLPRDGSVAALQS